MTNRFRSTWRRKSAPKRSSPSIPPSALVVTTDGSISDIPREEYEEAEERVISELKEINKPFIVLLNSTYPNAEETLCARQFHAGKI